MAPAALATAAKIEAHVAAWAAESAASENLLEDVERIAVEPPAGEPLMGLGILTEAVVLRPLVLVAQRLVRGRHFFELLLSLRIVRVPVRVVLQCLAPIGLLDCRLVGVLRSDEQRGESSWVESAANPRSNFDVRARHREGRSTWCLEQPRSEGGRERRRRRERPRAAVLFFE